MNSFVKFLLGFYFATSWAGAAEKPPMAHAMMGVANGCFVESVALLDEWRERMGGDPWARMLRWGAKEDEEVVAGHAVAICEARGKLWCYDINFGWTALALDPAQRENIDAVVTPIVAKYPSIKAQFPSYFASFPQEPGEPPPAAQPGNLNPSIRDASIVGETLGRHRPVNVVIFTEGVGAEKRESAVVAFSFGGRFCIYSPERGTVPFRVRGGVENLRLIQETLRRMFPGAGNLRKL